MRHTSTTFDEIVLVAGGARGYATGRFDLAPEHPPLMQYVYGLPAHLARLTMPDESGIPAELMSSSGYRYHFAQNYYFDAGNDPERVALLGRLPAVLFAAGLVLLAFAFVRSRYGARAGLMAATLVGFMPDVLAHGGVAYNDLPLAFLLLATLWAIDTAARRPSIPAGALAGVLFAVALGVKFSAVAILPMAGLLLLCEGIHRAGDRRWLGASAVSVLAAVVVMYAALVVIYRGDFLLGEFWYGLDYTFKHVNDGHASWSYLLGRRSLTGWTYFFPVAFLFKTPAALHVLMLVAALGLLAARQPVRVRDWVGSSLRVPVAGILVFGGALLTSKLNIGFRYALPLLPLLCVVTAVGVAELWRRSGALVRSGVVALVIWFAASSLSYYPHFLTYISEYGPGRDEEYRVLLDSSLDWGQGLLELRDYMRDHGVERVYLSYFGSARPEGYGIDYVAMPSFFLLPRRPPRGGDDPSHIVISATNLHGLYFQQDAFARFRDVRPDTVLARTLFVYRMR